MTASPECIWLSETEHPERQQHRQNDQHFQTHGTPLPHASLGWTRPLESTTRNCYRNAQRTSAGARKRRLTIFILAIANRTAQIFVPPFHADFMKRSLCRHRL